MWCLMLIVRLRQEDCLEFETGLGCSVDPVSENQSGCSCAGRRPCGRSDGLVWGLGWGAARRVLGKGGGPTFCVGTSSAGFPVKRADGLPRFKIMVEVAPVK